MRGFAQIFILAGVLILLALGYGVYFYPLHGNPSASTYTKDDSVSTTSTSTTSTSQGNVPKYSSIVRDAGKYTSTTVEDRGFFASPKDGQPPLAIKFYFSWDSEGPFNVDFGDGSISAPLTSNHCAMRAVNGLKGTPNLRASF
jgi:hypothetical protein